MELPKNITQIGETNPHCKIYVEDYVVSYIKQLNQYAGDKGLAVGLYGTRREENGISYLFLYGAGKLNFLQRESRHLSQAVLQEAEKLRKRYFPDYAFLGYRLLNGEMVEGFSVYEQGVCRYIEGYSQFYEKNDSMLAFMLEERQEEAKPEEVNQEKYDQVKKRQEERRQKAEALKRQATGFRGIITGAADSGDRQKKPSAAGAPEDKFRRMKMTAAAVFVLLCAAGLMTMGNGEKLQDLQAAARQLAAKMSERQLPEDGIQAAGGTAQAGTIVTEDKLTNALLRENEEAGGDRQGGVPGTPSPTAGLTETAGTEITCSPEPEATTAPAREEAESQEVQATPAAETTPVPEVSPSPVSYTVKRGDTLIGICLRQYGSDEKVSEICSLNHIRNADNIKEGQKILLP